MADEIAATGTEDAGSTPAPAPGPGSTPGAPDGTGTQPESVAAAGSTPATPAQGADEPPAGWANFLKKFTKDGKVDYEAAERSYWSATTGYNELARKHDAAQARLAELEKSSQPKEPAAPPPSPPEITRLEERIKSFETRKTQYATDRQTLAAEVRKLDREITRAEIEVERADPMDKPNLETRLAHLQAQQRDAAARWRQRGDQIDDLDHGIDTVKDRLSAEKERQEHAAAEAAEFNEKFPREVDGYIQAAAQELKLDIPTDYGSFAGRAVNALIILDCFLNKDKPAGSLDFPALAKSYVKEVAELIDSVKRANFATESAETLVLKKPLTPAPAAPKPAAPQVPEPAKRLKSWEDPANQDWRDDPIYRQAREGLGERRA